MFSKEDEGGKDAPTLAIKEIAPYVMNFRALPNFIVQRKPQQAFCTSLMTLSWDTSKKFSQDEQH